MAQKTAQQTAQQTAQKTAQDVGGKMKKVSLRRTVEKAIGAWRWCVSHTGIGLVYAGVAALAVLYLTGTTNSNALLCLPLILILAGTAGYVRQRKAREKY